VAGPSFFLFGCSPGTSNLGVDALLHATIGGLHERIDDAAFHVATLGWKRSLEQVESRAGVVRYQAIGVNPSRRFYSQYSTANLDVALRFPVGLTSPARVLKRSTALLDISAGDSFSDIYGEKRFQSVCYGKELAIRLGKPLILLPQTYGPFKEPSTERVARRLVLGAEQAWARDEDSFAVLRTLVGNDFDAQRHRCGVDVAFLLPAIRPSESIAVQVDDLAKRFRLIGLNISGLVYNAPEDSRNQFGLRADYRSVVDGLVRELLADPDNYLLLVPHVNARSGNRESDPDACRALLASLPSEMAARALITPSFASPSHVKWVISKCAWFCGTRMHSTIAALSTGVSTATLAYSMKARGVFASCGLQDTVVDPRSLETSVALERLGDCYRNRESVQRTLASKLPTVIERANAQFDAIAVACNEYGDIRR
jgi:colanic acid/amylovoran biosynthesis protein